MTNVISKKKLEANRRNALKSTGPKSLEGKKQVSRNALKHGLTAEKFVVIGENIKELERFRDRMIEALKPVGIEQEVIAEKIIELAIRLKRIKNIEAGMFNQEILEHEADDEKSKIAKKVKVNSVQENVELSGNELVRLTGLAFGRDCKHGSALLKLNTIEDKLLNKYFKLIEILRDQQKGVKYVISSK